MLFQLIQLIPTTGKPILIGIIVHFFQVGIIRVRSMHFAKIWVFFLHFTLFQKKTPNRSKLTPKIPPCLLYKSIILTGASDHHAVSDYISNMPHGPYAD